MFVGMYVGVCDGECVCSFCEYIYLCSYMRMCVCACRVTRHLYTCVKLQVCKKYKAADTD